MSALVFISGLGVKAAIGLPMLEQLTSANNKPLLLDLPEPPDEILDQTLDQQLHYISSKLIALIPDHSIIIGWSLGGLIAILLYKYAPEKINKLILIGSTPKFTSCAGWHCLAPETLNKFYTSACDDFPSLLQHFACLITHPKRNNTLLLKYLLLNKKLFLFYLKIICNSDTRQALANLKIPTIYIFGEHDAIVPIACKAQFKIAFPKVSTTVIANAGHMPFISHTTLTINKIKTFLATKNIRLAFNQAYRSYNANCQQQLLSSNYLIQLIRKHCANFNTILELGCGTGITNRLVASSLTYETMLCTDIADNLVTLAKDRLPKSCYCLIADFDALPIKNASINLCLANMALQWSYNIAHTLNYITKILTANGLLAFSLPTAGTFAELHQAIITTNCPCFLNTFYAKTELLCLLSTYNIIELKTHTKTNYFANIRELLHAIKKIGGSYLKNKPVKIITKDHLRAIDNYFYSKDLTMIPSTYEISYFIAVKK